jgi:hypothetical protein
MERFLKDCIRQLECCAKLTEPSASKTSRHVDSREIQEITKDIGPLDPENLTIDNVKDYFRETNPFLEDVLQELNLNRAEEQERPTNLVEEFQNLSYALKVENFPENENVPHTTSSDNEGKFN